MYNHLKLLLKPLVGDSYQNYFLFCSLLPKKVLFMVTLPVYIKILNHCFKGVDNRDATKNGRQIDKKFNKNHS